MLVSFFEKTGVTKKMSEVKGSTLFWIWPYLTDESLKDEKIDNSLNGEEDPDYLKDLEWDEEDKIWWGEVICFKLAGVSLDDFQKWYSGWEGEDNDYKYAAHSYHNFKMDMKYALCEWADWFTWKVCEWGGRRYR
jgi:hypothetical protein